MSNVLAATQALEDSPDDRAFERSTLKLELKAAKRGRRFPWGDGPNPKLANHGALDAGSLIEKNGVIISGSADDSDGFAGLAPVASFPSGATPEGVMDLAGNAAEWTSDGFDFDLWIKKFAVAGYSKASVVNPTGSGTSALRVVRGGSYKLPLVMLRSAARTARFPASRDPDLGFRCAKDSGT